MMLSDINDIECITVRNLPNTGFQTRTLRFDNQLHLVVV